MPELGKMLIIFGVILVVVGILMSAKIPFLGRLPGDIAIERDGLTFYAPIATSVILSIVLTIILNLFLRR